MAFVEIDHETLIKLIDLKGLEMKSISLIEEEDAVAKGENYASLVRRLQLIGTNYKGERTSANIFVKKGKQSAGPAEVSFFKCEIKVYKEILPEFKKLCSELKFLSDVPWSQCYGVRDYDAILLEDLVVAGYKMRNRRDPLTEDVAVFIAENIAIFHGLSRAAVGRGIIDPNSLHKNIFASNLPVINNLFGDGLSVLADTLEIESPWQSVLPKIKSISKDVGTRLANLGEQVKGIFPVINHGDCWTNNVLFKYEENTDKPVSLKFVDFQATHYGCFAWDLTYLMHTSMSAQTRQTCYKRIIETYRSTLIKTLEDLHEDSEVPDLNTMLQIMDQMAPFALALAFAMFPVTICTIDKPWDVDKIHNETNSTNITSPELYKNEIFKQSFKLDVDRFKKLGLL